jgi:hypothetical protein
VSGSGDGCRNGDGGFCLGWVIDGRCIHRIVSFGLEALPGYQCGSLRFRYVRLLN